MYVCGTCPTTPACTCSDVEAKERIAITEAHVASRRTGPEGNRLVQSRKGLWAIQGQ